MILKLPRIHVPVMEKYKTVSVYNFNLIFINTGAPIVVSWPHFYDGDQMYVNQSVGLNPDRVRHETFLSLEPVSYHFRFSQKSLQF